MESHLTLSFGKAFRCLQVFANMSKGLPIVCQNLLFMKMLLETREKEVCIVVVVEKEKATKHLLDNNMVLVKKAC